MLLIECLWCGLCVEFEFMCGGEVDIVCLVVNEIMIDCEWGEYVFMCENKCGFYKE